MVRRLGLSRDSLRHTLNALTEQGRVRRNPGHGHPMRPEYLPAFDHSVTMALPSQFRGSRPRRFAIPEILLIGGCLSVLIAYLAVERRRLDRHIRSIPLRIAVTGTRGKSSVVRLLTAALKEAGFTVLAKTTGSRPVHLLPDGSEEVIRRRGPASIAENKNLLKLGATLGVRALIAEMMSIHPENIFTESTHFIRPHVLVVTNVRPDHVAQMGSSRESVARSLSAAISKKTTVVVPKKEAFPIFEEAAKQHEARIVQVHENEKLDRSGLPNELEENIRLSLAVTHLLNIDRQTALRGMREARPDFGAPQVWRTEVGVDSLTWHIVSLFAANDPQSTRQALDRILEQRRLPAKDLAGLISLRRDRGDRSLLWRDALANGLFPELRYVFLCGDHASAIASKLRIDAQVQIIEEKKPDRIMSEIERAVQDEIVLVGMGNMGGLGQEMLSQWNEVGARP